MSWRQHALLIVVAVAAGAGGIYLGRAVHGPPPIDPAAGSVTIGAQGVPFELPTLDGGTVSPADFTGRVLIINFWATWCAPCIREIPLLVETRARLGADKVEVIGVAMDDPDAVRKFLAERDVPYPIALAKMSDAALMHAYGNERNALPFTVILDAQGRLAARKLGEYHAPELERDLALAMGE